MMRNKFLTSAATILVGALLAAGGAGAFPNGVPVGPAPLTCTTPSGAWTITLVSDTSGAKPYAEPCISGANAGKTCSTYKYTVAGSSTPDHVLFAASADQDLDALDPGNASSVAVPGAGDSKTGFLAYAKHEYPIRLNPTPGVPLSISFVGASSPRISTVLVTKGRLAESCLIAGPGVPGDAFQPVPTSETQLVAGGKCKVTKIFDLNGKLIDVLLTADAEQAGCTRKQEEGFPVVNGQVLRNNTSPSGITFGDNTWTCYGPPTPSIPVCIYR